MFGGLTKTSSRIAIAAALGMTLGGFAMSANPAKAADLGGDCCADLEERVAELEATTVRKGNKKVSVTLSGWVVKLGSGGTTATRKTSTSVTRTPPCRVTSRFPVARRSAPAGPLVTRSPSKHRAQRSAGFVENQINDNRLSVRRHQHAPVLYVDQERQIRYGQLGSAEPGDG